MSSHADAHVAHHFENAEQQRQSAQLGMWVFLVTEVMFFGGLFAAYAIYRAMYPDAWVVGSHLLSIKLGGFNTAVLLGSSLTMALAVHAAQTDKRKATAMWIVLTMILGFVFLGVKVVEYAGKIDHHLAPGPNFHLDPLAELAKLEAAGVKVGDHLRHAFEGARPVHVQLFYSLYFAMTGMHAVHMIIGAGIMLWLLVTTLQGRYSSKYSNPVEISGLYWHFVDIVWIIIFTLVYLIPV